MNINVKEQINMSVIMKALVTHLYISHDLCLPMTSLNEPEQKNMCLNHTLTQRKFIET